MSVLIGHAAIDEFGNSTGGNPGDQSGREICTRTWYDKKWIKVFRPIGEIAANHIAEAMEAACENNNIGYSSKSSDKNATVKLAKNAHWDLSKIEEPCATDNGGLVQICINSAGITLNKPLTVINATTVLKRCGKFNILTDKKYLQNSNALKRGDILLSNDHIAVVLNDGSESLPQELVKKSTSVSNKKLSGTGMGFLTLSTLVDLRLGASDKYVTCGQLKKGTKVEVLAITPDKWYKIVCPSQLSGYAYLFDSNAKYESKKEKLALPTAAKVVRYQVQPTAKLVSIYKAADETSPVSGLAKMTNTYTIIKEKNGWGMLSSGLGWIQLNNTKKV